MPDNLYFSEPQTQEMLLDVLFIWAKLNPDTSYRQGMHEVLAPVLWVVERDAVEPCDSDRGRTGAGDFFDSDYIAHDTFTLFGLIMQHHKEAYAVGTAASIKASGKTATDVDSPMVQRCRHIMDLLLVKSDPALAKHLKEIEIVPQVFLLRWIRLLFGREFSFDETLQLWDSAFAHGTTLSCVDYICVAMLLRIRWQLINGGYDEALPLLLRYPPLPPEHQPSGFVEDAAYLQNNLNPQGGAHIITKYTGRTPSTSEQTRPSTPRLDSKQFSADNHTSRRAFSPFSTPSRLIQESGGFDSLLQDAARGVYLKGEQWGVNKAVRDAVVEVRKNVQTLQSRSPIPGSALESSMSGQATSGRDNTSELLTKIDELHRRNKALASMLQNAVGDLWAQQDTESADDERTKTFTMAVAKVQLVQVYLEDSSLQVAPDEAVLDSAQTKTETSGAREPIPPPQDHYKPALDQTTAQTKPGESIVTATPQSSKPAALTDTSTPTKAPTKAPKSRNSKASPAPTSLEVAAPSTDPSSRPSLQSSFSWMLGQPQEENSNKPSSTHEAPRSLFDSPFAAASSPYASSPPPKRANAARSKSSFLFGDVDELAPEAASRMGSSVEPMREEEKMMTRRGSRAKPGRRRDGRRVVEEEEEEIVQLDDMES
jgi:TBC1 domain family protein 5